MDPVSHVHGGQRAPLGIQFCPSTMGSGDPTQIVRFVANALTLPSCQTLSPTFYFDVLLVFYFL